MNSGNVALLVATNTKYAPLTDQERREGEEEVEKNFVTFLHQMTKYA